jgi:hypothetical protein
MSERIPAMDPAVLLALQCLEEGEVFDADILVALTQHGLLTDTGALTPYAHACRDRQAGNHDGRCLSWSSVGGRCALADEHEELWHQSEQGDHRWAPLAPIKARLQAYLDGTE